MFDEELIFSLTQTSPATAKKFSTQKSYPIHFIILLAFYKGTDANILLNSFSRGLL
jgi:hypothetical protein